MTMSMNFVVSIGWTKYCFRVLRKQYYRVTMLQTDFRLSCMNRAQILSGIRDSRKAESLWGMMRSVGGVRKSIDQSCLTKGLGLGLLCWGFKGVQEEVPREEASTLQIGSVEFPPGRYTSPQLHPCHRLSNQDGQQGSSSPHPPYRSDIAPCDFWLFSKLRDCRYETIEEMKEAMI